MDNLHEIITALPFVRRPPQGFDNRFISEAGREHGENKGPIETSRG